MSARKKPRRPSWLWRALLRWARLKVRNTRARARKALGPKVVATASAHWQNGENLVPRIQPYPWRHYVAPDDLEIYEADIGGYVFEFELMPESRVELEKAAFDAAVVHFGPYVDSQPLNEIRAISPAAFAVLPEPMRG